MAAPDFTVTRGGQINQTGDDRALFLKTYGGEVFTSFEETNVFGGLTMSRSISSGKSASFPSVGGKTAAYRTPGVMSVGTAGNLAETIITVDAFIEAATSIAEIDLAMTHFDFRQPLTREDGMAIARLYDQNVARTLVQTALETTSRFASGDPNEAKTVGKVWDVVDSNTNPAVLKQVLTDMATEFDEKDVPEYDRNFACKPATYHLLAADNETINADYGSIADQSTLKVNKLRTFALHKSNNIPTTNVTGTYQDKYNVDARNVVGIGFLPGAVGTVKVRDLSVGMTGNDYKVTHNATLVTSRMLVGHGKLRPELAQLVRTADPAA